MKENNTHESGRKKELIWLAAVAAAAFLLGYLTITIMRAANGLPIPVKAPMFIFMQWLPLAAPAAVMLIRGESIKEALRVKKEPSPAKQILSGAAAGFLLSVLLMLIPFALGFKEYIYTDGGYTKLWQMFYYLASYIIGTALAEELLFRGYIYSAADRALGELPAVVISSVLFGAFHILNGNIAQVIFTAFIGAVFCLARRKIKGFTLLSLIFMHGIYDFMIPLWAGLF